MQEIKKINKEAMNEMREVEALQLENEELRKELAKLKAETKQFTYIVSHDLQAPLRSITGFVELLKRRYSDKLDEPALKFIDHAVKGTEQMKKLIFDLLEYSRLNTDTNELTEVDLELVVKKAKEKLMTVINESGATIISEHLPVVVARKEQMEKLFFHLLDNSLKFRNGTVPQICINAKKENKLWEIAISDNGIGIEPMHFEKIFVIFRRLHNDETKYAGRGLGLAVCKKIVELHGGSIQVESEPEKGTTFTFTLPEKDNFFKI